METGTGATRLAGQGDGGVVEEDGRDKSDRPSKN